VTKNFVVKIRHKTNKMPKTNCKKWNK